MKFPTASYMEIFSLAQLNFALDFCGSAASLCVEYDKARAHEICSLIIWYVGPAGGSMWFVWINNIQSVNI